MHFANNFNLKKMKQLLVFSFLVLLCFYSIGQKRCALKSLPQESKDELIKFWRNFQESISQKDTSKLLLLCDFPFTVSTIIVSHNRRDIGQSFKLESKDIMQYATLLFFEKQFESALLLCNDPADCLILHGDWNKKHKTCVYEFFYKVQDKSWVDQERSFSIVRVDSSYKIVCNWVRY